MYRSTQHLMAGLAAVGMGLALLTTCAQAHAAPQMPKEFQGDWCIQRKFEFAFRGLDCRNIHILVGPNHYGYIGTDLDWG